MEYQDSIPGHTSLMETPVLGLCSSATSSDLYYTLRSVDNWCRYYVLDGIRHWRLIFNPLMEAWELA